MATAPYGISFDIENVPYAVFDRDQSFENRFFWNSFLLSGSFTPFESMPPLLQDIMYISLATHFVRFAQSVLYRGAGIDVVWLDLAIMVALGGGFLAVALSRFRVMLSRQG